MILSRKAFLLLILTLISANFAAQEDVDLYSHFWEHIQKMPLLEPPSHDEIRFADFLFEHGLYDDAITEYSRFIYANRDDANRDYALFQKAVCYFKINDNIQARSTLNELAYSSRDQDNAFRARLILSLHYVATGDMKRGRFELQELQRTATLDRQGLINYFFGWMDLIDGEIESANLCFEKSFRDTLTPKRYQKRAYEIHRWFNAEDPELPDKSPAIAAFASSILPGTGQMYAGSFADGINSMIINAGCGYLTISNFTAARYFQGAYILYFLWKRYYLGGISNAEARAIEFNDNARDEIIASLMDAFL